VFGSHWWRNTGGRGKLRQLDWLSVAHYNNFVCHPCFLFVGLFGLFIFITV